MRFLLLLSLTVSSIFAVSPKALPYVDTTKFSGLWYEMARTYNKYEKGCVAATVEYKLQSDGEYKVFNRCFKKVIGGEKVLYKGDGKPVQKRNSATLDLTYYWFFTSRYNIIYMDEKYETAIMADKAMKAVWIMHRKPKMEDSKLKELVAKIKPYMDVSRLIYTPQASNGRYR